MRLLERLRPQNRIFQLIMFAIEGAALVRPQHQDALERLIEHLQPLGDWREWNARHLELSLRPSGAETREQSAIAHVIERDQTLRGDGRMTKQIAQHQMT